MPATAPAPVPARRIPRAPTTQPGTKDKPKVEPKILFQSYFKSVGPRTYAAQVKEAGNGNHFLVLTEGKRDAGSEDVRKTKLFVFSEDFVEFFRLVKQTAEFIKANPVSPKVRQKREKFWAKQTAPVAGA
jgi:Protein of unknown function (DUF3276)